MGDRVATALKVVKVEKLTNEKVVFNLAVKQDESYVANGVVSHNCRCRLAPATEHLPEMPESNEEEFLQWVTSESET